MIWVYGGVGALWIIDGFLFFVFPAVVRQIFVRAFREGRYIAASAGPAAIALVLVCLSFKSSSPWILRTLALFSFLQAVFFFRAVRTTSPRAVESIIALPDGLYRLWGLILTLLGPFLIYLRP